MIVHDHGDKMVPYRDASTIARKNSRISFYSTKGLGHKRILRDRMSVEAVFQFLTNITPEIDVRQPAELHLTEHEANAF